MRKNYLHHYFFLVLPLVFNQLLYCKVYNRPIRFVQSKHIPQDICNHETRIFDELAQHVGYPFSRIGTYRKLSQNEDILLTHRISKGTPRPIKFVITKDNRIWADNTHAALACILKYGINVKIHEVPYYLVDLRFSIPIVTNLPHTFCISDLKVAINNAMWIDFRLHKNWRPLNVSFTIDQLFHYGKYAEGWLFGVMPD